MRCFNANAIFSQTKKQLQGYGIMAVSQKELLAIPDNQRLTLILYINISVQLIEEIDVVPINSDTLRLEFGHCRVIKHLLAVIS